MRLEKKRIVEIDILRGFALFGVLLVNLTMMDSTLYGHSLEALHGKEEISYWAIRLLAQGKFYTIFAFLFGLGFYYFSKGRERYKKRLWVLFVFGILHSLFVWYGDILHLYAVAGYFLMRNSHLPNKRLLRKMILLAIYTFSLMIFLAGSSPQEFNEARRAGEVIYQSASYAQMIGYRVQHELPLVLSNLIFTVPKVLILFYFGFICGRKQWLEHLDHYQSQMKRIILWSGIFFVTVLVGTILSSNYGYSILEPIFEEVGTYAGSVFYGASVLYLSRYRWMDPLAAVGRMALTNYLIQTSVWTFILGGYGLGYFGTLSYGAYLPLTVAFFGFQILFSNLWVKRYAMGPMEKLWRKLYAS